MAHSGRVRLWSAAHFRLWSAAHLVLPSPGSALPKSVKLWPPSPGLVRPQQRNKASGLGVAGLASPTPRFLVASAADTAAVSADTAGDQLRRL